MSTTLIASHAFNDKITKGEHTYKSSDGSATLQREPRFDDQWVYRVDGKVKWKGVYRDDLCYKFDVKLTYPN